MEIKSNTFKQMKKQELGDILATNYKTVQRRDKTLAEQIAYASKAEHKATKGDLLDLVNEVFKLLGDKLKMPVLAEEPETEEEEQTPEAPKTEPKVENSAKPKLAKKSAKKSDVVDTLEDDSPATRAVERVSHFKEEITVGDDTYVVSKISSMEDLAKKFEDDPEANILFVFYQSKRNMKQFGYFPYVPLPKNFSFEDDVDITSVIYVSDESKIAYSVSVETEAIYIIIPSDFEYVDGVRVSGTCEFEIYEKKVEPKPANKRKPRK